ncbi:type II secretion system F family protein [Okibacterium endophyticum]
MTGRQIGRRMNGRRVNGRASGQAERERSRGGAPVVERIAAVAERVAVMLEAGVTPNAAWQYLADPPPGSRGEPKSGGRSPAERRRTMTVRGGVSDPEPVEDVVAAAARAGRTGEDVADAIVEASSPHRRGAEDGAADAWRALASAWMVATETGAPLASTLHQLARSQRSLGQTQRDIQAALAGPRSTSRLVMVLPFVGILFGLALGFDTLHTLFATGPGLACLGTGLLLMLVAWRWSAQMVRKATPSESAPGLTIELTAIAMGSGVSVERARASVSDAIRRCSPGVRSAEESEAVDAVLALSRAAGIPAAELLRGEAAQARRDARSSAQLASAALATRLMLPLGACILPAFMLVGVAPLMLSVLASTLQVV